MRVEKEGYHRVVEGLMDNKGTWSSRKKRNIDMR